MQVNCKDVAVSPVIEYNRLHTKVDLFLFSFLNSLEDKDIKSVMLASKAMLNSCLQTLNYSNLRPMLARAINLSEPEVLRQYMAAEFQEGKYLTAACRIAKNIYESHIRGIKDTQYGSAFAMDAEVLAYIMKDSANKVALEIAGASGENAILMAFSHFERVYYNDITPQEVDAFKKLKFNLPSDVSRKLEIIAGSCFDILNQCPEISKKVDVVLCRNLIHFFTNKQQQQLFDVLKKTLKVGGKAIFMVNSAYSLKKRFLVEQHLEATTFKSSQVLLTDYMQGTMPIDQFYLNFSACHETEISNDYETLYLRVKDSILKPWQVNDHEFKKIDASIRDDVKKSVSENLHKINSICMGSVRFLTSHLRLFNSQNLTNLFEKHGFEVESTFVVSKQGHLINHSEYYEKGQQLGIIVKYSH